MFTDDLESLSQTVNHQINLHIQSNSNKNTSSAVTEPDKLILEFIGKVGHEQLRHTYFTRE